MRNKVTLGFTILSTLIVGVIVYFVVQNYNSFADGAPVTLTDDFGIVTFVASLPARTNKLTVISKATKAGFTWTREEFTYTDPMNYVPFDSAYNKITGKSNLKILGLLTYPGPQKSHDVWKNYVAETVGRYPGIDAWEIMNEVDNELTAAEYTPYLKEAHSIIKARSNVPVICTGLTARPEAYEFWDGLVASGGWAYCDGLGLHPYHEGDPLAPDANGTLSEEIEKAILDIEKNSGASSSTALGASPSTASGANPSTALGASKKIWVTEFGYDSKVVGEANQAKWLVEGMSVLHSFPEVEKIFAFRLYEHDNGYGLVNVNYEEKPAFATTRNWLASTASMRPTNLFSQGKSSIRIEGATVISDGKDQFTIIVSLKDRKGEYVSNIKPTILVTGGPATLTDFELKNQEWVAKIASTDKGQKNAEIKVGEKVLGTAVVFFSATEGESVVNPAATAPQLDPTAVSHEPIITMAPEIVVSGPAVTPIETEPTARTKAGLGWFMAIEAVIAIFIIMIVIILNRQRINLGISQKIG